ncbi:DUF645 family protein [Vibrio cholerae]|uniref:DUF645 family protein n=1 Tax=Vibrio cholerae TaxID=666 RepID=UPI0011F2BEE6|nr:DUF645 family protein [Vibrio cholerae]KAA1198045.1 DUF645 family protein [Vibrio cholerae]HBC3478433.1 DUF645 family protein [Vibrio cholerae]
MFNSVNLVSQKAASSLKSCFFVGNAVSGQLNLDRYKFWQLTSQLLALEVCLSDALRKMHFKQMCLKSHW